MSDIVYRLIVDMSSRGSLEPHLGKLQQQSKGLDASLKGLGVSLASGLGAASNAIERVGDKAVSLAAKVAAIGAVGLGAGITYGVAHLNNELEKTKISLGAIFNAQGIVSGMPAGLKLASGTIAEMRKDAAMLPGEFGDLLSFFKLGATPAFRSGASVQQLEKMSAMGMAAAAATGVQMDQAAREFAQLLQGRAGAHNVFGSLIGFSGEQAQNFNQMTGSERLKQLESALTKYQASIEVYGGSFDALTSTMRDNAKQVLQRATAPLFNRVKDELAGANKWFDTHQDTVMRFADTIADKLVVGFDLAKTKIIEWAPAIKSFGEHAVEAFERIWQKADPLFAKVEDLAKHVLADPKLFQHLETAAKLYGVAKVGNAIAPGVSGVAGMFGKDGILGAGGAFGASGALSGLTAAAGPLTIGLAALGVAVAGATDVLVNDSALGHDLGVESAQKTMEAATMAVDSWSQAALELRPLVDALGVGLLWNVQKVTESIAALGVAAQVASNPFKYISRLFGLDNPDEHTEVESKFEYRPFPKATDAGPEPEKPSTKKGAGGGGGGTHIQKVEIVVSSNQDPSRIARMVGDHLEKLSRFPTSTRFATNPSAPR